MIDGTSTFSIPTVRPLQSVFNVGEAQVTEQYGEIVFPATKSSAVVNASVASTGGAAVTTGQDVAPFQGAALTASWNTWLLLPFLSAVLLAAM